MDGGKYDGNAGNDDSEDGGGKRGDREATSVCWAIGKGRALAGQRRISKG